MAGIHSLIRPSAPFSRWEKARKTGGVATHIEKRQRSCFNDSLSLSLSPTKSTSKLTGRKSAPEAVSNSRKEGKQ